MRNLMDLMAPNGCHPAIQPLRMPKGRCQFAGKEGFAFLQHLAASNKTHLRHTQEQLRSNAVLLSSSSSRHLWSSMTLILISSSSSAASSSSSSQPRRALLMIVRVWGRVNCRAFQLKRARAQDSANRDPCSRQFSADWRHRSTDSGQSPAEIKFQMFCIKWIMNHYSNIFESLTFLTNFACFTQYSTPSITIICWRVMLHPVVFWFLWGAWQCSSIAHEGLSQVTCHDTTVKGQRWVEAWKKECWWHGQPTVITIYNRHE